MKMALEQKQMLKMVMTTELRQAIELLQFSTYEMLQFIQEQAEENPFIELIEKEESMTISTTRPRKVSSEGTSADPLELATKHEKTMHEQLLDQLMWMQIPDAQYKLVSYLILNINEQGYLTVSDEMIHQTFSITQEALEEARTLLHELEPRGIGARNLSECLKIQALEKYPDDPILIAIIENYLQQIGDKQWQKVAQTLGVTLTDIKESVEKIQTLNPRPAASLSVGNIDYVQPDIMISYDEKEARYTVQLNDYYLPKIQFNEQYSNEVAATSEASQYVNQQFRKFDWLQKSIEQRRSTILKIMKVIIREQQGFLREGFRALKPLTLKDVADEIEMHESTVSRATANKIVRTPVGTFELRTLFSTKLATQSGSDASQTEVKAILHEIVEKENKQKPLSDQKIADILKENNGIIISRRTVAKYRDELNIPSSSKRKEILV